MARKVDLHHPDQLWWPELGLRKRHAFDYYHAIAPVLLPHLRDRPFTLKQHYNGLRSPFRWIKDRPPEAPEWIRTTPQPAKSRGGAIVDYVLVNARATLLVREMLDALGLESYPLTTGGDGMHVRVPVARRHTTYEDARDFARVVESTLARAGLRRVKVDVKMNGHGQQIVAPYSIRPLPEAAVAAPLAWNEVDEALEPAAFTPAAVLERVERHGDLLAPLLRNRQS